MGITSLAACGSDDADTSSASGADGTPVEIQYWHTNSDANGRPAVQALVRRFNAANPGIHVTERTYDGYAALLENVQTGIASRRPPDVATVGYNSLNYVAGNFPVVPVSELVERYGDEGPLRAMPENIAALGQQDGRQIGLPYGLSLLVVFYNADLLRRAGVSEAPRDWAGWEAAARTIARSGGDPAINFQQYPGDNFISQALIAGNGGAMTQCVSGETKAAFAQPPAVEAMSWWAGLIRDRLALNVTADQSMQSFLAGRAATLITSIASRETLEQQARFDVQAAPFPTFGGKPQQLPAGGNTLMVFSQEDAKQEAAWKFAQFLDSRPSLETWVHEKGYLSPIPGVARDFTARNPMQAVADAELPAAIPWTSWPGRDGLAATQVVSDATDTILGGQKSAADALTPAAEEIDDTIAGASCQ
ncbi:ABC transporter substrate-binding protein [Conexibacter sp. JD483]|uniref:ABC transporter substrate-binding protein n=1 Tax=unclassified Conexibacter TaxID=2627773 RepID=UPI00271B2790|nr:MULTISPECIES: ABC transporter substrate-binding protein [unclassified Conexibacter]MDO8189041.1 ABC transporter substrate-binding protein [Conexibacter sp. CPCC 205706]MDO8198518.1 ABC transporter substrate-binding protein [Conexibacter sp. CPCC 205762]MDR9367604.1 ABC transporter substrate-binding protein [Conexibacter sp. JD483]